MGNVYNRIESIWSNLEESYERLSKEGETRKSFLLRICGENGAPLTSLIVSLEKEISEDEQLIEQGRQLSEILSAVRDNFTMISKHQGDISNLSMFVADIVRQYIKSKNVQEFDYDSLSYSPTSSVVLDSIEMLTRFKSVTSYVESSKTGVESVKILPVEYQSSVVSIGFNSLLWIKDLISRVGTTEYLKQAHNITCLHFEKENAPFLVFLPKNKYRKTQAGCNVVVDGNTIRFPTTDYLDYMGEKIPYTDYHGIWVLHLKHDHEPLY